jgi:hypothetical protein
MEKNHVYKSHLVTLCLFFLFVVHLAFPSYFVFVFVGSLVHSSFIATFDDYDDGPFVSKMKGVTFQRRPPRAHGQCTHTLGTKKRENSNLQNTLLDFVA